MNRWNELLRLSESADANVAIEAKLLLGQYNTASGCMIAGEIDYFIFKHKTK